MITYIYKCTYHGEFEASHKINEKLTDCPQCKAEDRQECYCPDCNNIWPADNIDYYCTKCYRDESAPTRTPQVTRLISGGGSFILSGGGWASSGYTK